MRNKIAAILDLTDETKYLKPLTNRRPIATLPFACRYRLIDLPFSSLYYAQVMTAALFLSGDGNSMYDHIRAGSQWGLDSLIGGGAFIHTQVDVKEKKEDAALYYNDHRDFLARNTVDYVLFMGGKLVSNVDIRPFLEYCTFKEADGVMMYKKMPRSLFGKDTATQYVSFDEKNAEYLSAINPVIELDIEENEEIPVSLEVFLIKRSKVDAYIQEAEKQQLPLSPTVLMQLALLSDDEILTYEHHGYARFIETMSDYFEANMDMLNESNFYSLFNQKQPVITKVKNGAPTYYGEKADVTLSQLASDCVIDGKVTRSMIHRKTVIESGADVSDSILTFGGIIEEDAVLQYVILDKNVTVKKGVRVIGTRENPVVIRKNTIIDTSIV